MALIPDRRSVLIASAGLAAHSAVGAPAQRVFFPEGGSTSTTATIVTGAIGDGTLHPLAERFSTLDQARAVFPCVTNLSDSIDGAAIQTAIDQAERRGGGLQIAAVVLVPAGRYPLSRSLRLPNSVILQGEGAGATIIDNQNAPMDAPLIVNSDPTVVRTQIRRLSLHGGTHGVRINASGYVEGIHLEAVSFELQTDKNFECNKLLQMAAFRDCRFGRSPFGFYVSDWTSNVVSFDGCSFENHSQAHLYLRGAECVAVRGGRFEGGALMRASTGAATLDIEDGAAVAFVGVYFENTHRVLLKERRSRDGIRFEGCHFTGTMGTNGRLSYEFDSDGIVTFSSNDWGMTTKAPRKVAVSGLNAGLMVNDRLYLVRTATHHHIASESVPLTNAIGRPLVVVRLNGSGGESALILAGVLTLEIRLSNAGSPTVITHRIDVSAHVVAGAIMLSSNPPLDHSAAPARIRVESAGNSRGASMVLASLRLPAAFSGELRWRFEGSVSGGEPQKASLSVDFE